MAVLKTSGTLNRCPCVVLKERSDAHIKSTEHLAALRPPTLTPSSSRSTTPLPRVPGGTELKHVTEEDVNAIAPLAPSSSASSTQTRRASMDSNGTTISALEVYLRTKIGT
jgi:hypothetical protein